MKTIINSIKENYSLYKRAKISPDPLISGITETVMIIIEDDIVEIMHCQSNLADLLINNTKIIKLGKKQVARPGWKYVDGKIIDPHSIMATYPHTE